MTPKTNDYDTTNKQVECLFQKLKILNFLLIHTKSKPSSSSTIEAMIKLVIAEAVTHEVKI